MLRVLALSVVCAGCYDPSFSPGSACDTVCPGNLVCIDHVCRDPGFVHDANLDAPRDADGDGVLDDVDNCISAGNADQHDEDQDLIGDVCDPCPHLAGTMADGDSDGVGDACDPQPEIAKQTLRFFDPFTSDLTEWSHSTGVTRSGETLRASGDPATFTRLFVPNGESRIALAGRVSTTSATTPHQVSVAFGFNTANTIHHYCQFYDTGDTGRVSIMRDNQGMYSALAFTSYAGTLPTGPFAMTIDASVNTQQIRFASTLGGTEQQTLNASTATAPTLTPSGMFSLYVRNADVRIDYVVVIETLP